MQINFDLAGWSQDEKNMVHASISALLHAGSVTHKGIKKIDNNSFEIKDPSSNPTILLTDSLVRIKANEILTAAETARLAAKVEDDAKKEEAKTNVLMDRKLVDVDAAIDSINNIAEIKAY